MRASRKLVMVCVCACSVLLVAAGGPEQGTPGAAAQSEATPQTAQRQVTPPATGHPPAYDRDQLVQITITDEAEVAVLQALDAASIDFVVWSEGVGIGKIDVRVTPEQRHALDASGLPYEVTIDDLAQRHAELFGGARGGWFFDTYRTYDEHVAYMNGLVAGYPDLAQMVNLGSSVLGRPLWAIRITGPGGDKPGAMYHGGQHGNEIMGPCVIAYTAQYLLTNYGIDPDITALVDNVEWFLLPIMNPDGYELGRRYNANNFDLNRNWGGPGSYPDPFSQPETAAMRDFFISHPNVRAHSDLHSHGFMILWPWGHTAEFCADHWTFDIIATQMRARIFDVRGVDYDRLGPIFTTIYPVFGGSEDYTYGVHGIWTIGFEIGYGFWMPEYEIFPTSHEIMVALLHFSEMISDCNWNGVPDIDDISTGTSVDCNENGMPDECESGGAEDCNGNGQSDLCDLYLGTSQDCNSNFLPDDCELLDNDCNGNGVPDECDTAAGTSADCNNNDIPDECELAANDCNANGVLDVCDISSGVSQDCNGNAVPDECDLADGTSGDCNENDLPDECEPGGTSDCNANDVADLCDLYGGTSEDCNADGTPDECQLEDNDCNANGIPDECELDGNDCNENGTLDECDIANGTSTDCNANWVPDECETDCNITGLPDECDIANGTSADCNSNGTPDECELAGNDCNLNGTLDECDIIAGISEDCDGDGTPAECDDDCNSNGVPDECDIANCDGSAWCQDCQPDRVPDECQNYNGGGGEDTITINIFTDAFPTETTWKVRLQDSNVLVASGGPYALPDTLYTETVDVNQELCYRFTIYDSYGDGICCYWGNGYYEVYYGPDLVGSGGSFGISEIIADICGAPLVVNDCNADLIPDECQLEGNDCNDNASPDDCDIAQGDSPDLNGNGVPDECEDCNQNGLPDECDLSCGDPGGPCDHPGCGVSTDCNSNGTPDECELYEIVDGAIQSPVNNHFYALTPSGMTWQAAEAYAASLGAHLATVRNAEENQWIVDAFAGPSPETRVWIGFNDLAIEGAWVWTSGEPVTYTNWRAGEPNNAGNEDAAVLFVRVAYGWQPGEWNDGQVTNQRHGLLEFSITNDCNENGILDECDIADGTSEDCNESGTPDECEPGGVDDCNGNGFSDLCDIYNGASEDCNENNTPDECEQGGTDDCNANGVADLCDGDFEDWALGFDGVDDLVRLPDDLVRNEDTLTFEAWFNTLGMGVIFGYQNAAYPSGVSNYVPAVYVGTDGGLRGQFWNGHVSPITTAFAVNDGLWHHVALVANSNTQALYVDGDAIGNPLTRSINHLDMSYNQIGLGLSSHHWPSLGSGWKSFEGLIDDVRLWSVARTEDELRDNMSGIPGGSHADLVGRWRFNDGQGQVATDSSGRGHHGTLGVDVSLGWDSSDPNWVSSDSPEIIDDCNENGVLDECDIADGTSEDCNENGVPDECELGGTVDCNGNGIIDLCEPGGAEDCNGNGVPDWCDIADGTGDDCNDDGVPDQCEIEFGNGALDFDGMDDVVRVARTTLLEPVDELTIEAWVRPDSAGAQHSSIVRNATPNGYILAWQQGHDHRAQLRIGGALQGSVSVKDTVSTNDYLSEWHHLAGVYSASGNFARLYVDGVLKNELPAVGALQYSGGDLYFGNWTGCCQDFEGMIDEIRIWSVARTQQEIVDHKDHVLTGMEDGLVGYWRFNEGDGQTASDQTPHGHDGMLGGNSAPGGDGADPAWAVPGAPIPHKDCNENGILDECDIADGTSEDCNESGTPDECELGGIEDCNSNGMSDLCDIHVGTSDDCNENAAPDECEFAGAEDCNGNGIIDLCEPGGAEDCNLNGVSDWCDIANGTSNDCNDNNTPDECDLRHVITIRGGNGEIGAADSSVNALAGPADSGFGAPFSSSDFDAARSGPGAIIVTPEYNYVWPLPADPQAKWITTDPSDRTGLFAVDFTVEQLDIGPAMLDLFYSVDNYLGEGAIPGVYINGAPIPGASTGGDHYNQHSITSVDVTSLLNAGTNTLYIYARDTGGPGGLIFSATIVIGGASEDCNANGTPDDCDVVDGTSEDCNENGVPDECEFAGTVDCNGNDVVDLCEPGGSEDCNGNGVPDFCDVADGTSGDCNANLIPDECETESVGSSLSFDGNNDFVNMGTDPSLDLVSGFTLEAWIACDTMTGMRRITSKGRPGVSGYAFGQIDGRLTFVTYGIYDHITSGVYLATGEWTHVAVVFDTSNDAHFYVNGSYVETVVGSSPVNPSPNPFYLGKNASGGAEPWSGRIDEVRLWNIERTGQQISGSMASTLTGWEPSLIGYWRLDEGAGQIAQDSSPNDHDGMLGSNGDPGGDNGDPSWVSPGAPIIYRDCNGNGILDECDIADGTSADCNVNALPDECEFAGTVDCNGNGIIDLCEPGGGDDCNENGVPDWCDITDGTSGDCNLNLMPDECEPDCNRNDLPDECDILNGASADCNLNGFPDECEFDSVDTALCFDGSDDYVIVPRSEAFEPMNELTIEAWVSPDTAGARYSRIVRNATPNGYILAWQQNNDRRAQLRIDGAAQGSLAVKDTVSTESYLGEWHHLAGVYSAVGDYARLYVDGVLKNETQAAGTLQYSGGDLKFGNWTGCCEDFDGLIDEIRIWELARSGQEIQDHMFVPLHGNEPGLVGYWRLNEAGGQYVYDASAYDNHGWLGDDGDAAGDSADPLWVTSDSPMLSLDCNGNGVLDECDIADGTSDDCNANGIPDECEFAGTEDCNGNGIIDLCEPGGAEDCNMNGVSDWCDITEGTSGDCNGSGVPDECEITPGPIVAPVGALLSPVNNHYYLLTPRMSWPQAEAYATDLGGHLATVRSSDENQWILDTFFPYSTDDAIYIGFNDIESEGTWVWSSGEPVTFTNWAPGEPSGGSEDWGELALRPFYAVSPGEWNDVVRSDMGVVEIVPVNDCNNNDMLDECDIADGTSADCNANAIPDECEFAGTEDCNGNGIIDLCEPGGAEDCNLSGVPDWRDIAEGTSYDCNDNSTPDDCEPDCNGNAVPDDCDVIDGTSDDCNTDGMPDECTFAEPGAEVLINGGAEAGDLDGWMRNPSNAPIGAVTYQVQSTGIVEPFDGDWFFSFARQPLYGIFSMTQEGITGLEYPALRFDLSGYVQSEGADRGEALIEFFDEYGTPLSSASTGTMTTTDLTWEPFGLDVEIPLGAAAWRLSLLGQRVSGDPWANVFYDAVELRSVSMPDCNGNGILDECDIADGTSGDCDSDGIPDECDEVFCCLTCPDDMTVECDGMGNVDDLNAWLDSLVVFSTEGGCASITDNFTGLSDECGQDRTATVTWTAVDADGLVLECSSTFTILASHRTLYIKHVGGHGPCPPRVHPVVGDDDDDDDCERIKMLLVGDVDFDVWDVDVTTLELRRCDGLGGFVNPCADGYCLGEGDDDDDDPCLPNRGIFKYKDRNYANPGDVGCGEGQLPCACGDDDDDDDCSGDDDDDDDCVPCGSRDCIIDLEVKVRLDSMISAGLLQGGYGELISLVLCGELSNGCKFSAVDCIRLVHPGAQVMRLNVRASTAQAFVDVWPPDELFDTAGYAEFDRFYPDGAVVTLTPEPTVLDLPFLAWEVDGVRVETAGSDLEVVVDQDGKTVEAVYGFGSMSRGQQTTPNAQRQRRNLDGSTGEPTRSEGGASESMSRQDQQATPNAQRQHSGSGTSR